MILEVSQLDLMVNRILSLKKVRIGSGKYQDEVKGIRSRLLRIFEYIDYFNSLSDLSTMVFDVEFSKIPILNEFKDFMIPASVKMNAADLNCEEMLIKPEVKNLDTFSLNEYLDLCLDFRSLFKKDLTDNVTSLDSFRKNVSWSEVANKACYSFTVEEDGTETVDLFVHYNSDVPFIPVQISSFITGGYKSRYWNFTVTEVINDYLTRWLI